MFGTVLSAALHDDWTVLSAALHDDWMALSGDPADGRADGPGEHDRLLAAMTRMAARGLGAGS
ncbi:MAG: hypothetical protein ACR2G2_06835 [Pseudonocardia sp.]